MPCHSRLPWIALAFSVTVAGLANACAGGDVTGNRAARGGGVPTAVAVAPTSTSGAARQGPAPAASPPAAGHFEGLMAMGAAGVALLLLCRSQQAQFPVFAAGTVVGALVAAAYGFLQGAWPLGVALTAYAVASAVRSCRSLIGRRRRPPPAAPIERAAGRRVPPRWADPTRVERMFGRP